MTFKSIKTDNHNSFMKGLVVWSKNENFKIGEVLDFIMFNFKPYYGSITLTQG